MLRALRKATPDASILVVDDGSPDGTADAADIVNKELGAIYVLRRNEKNGLGAAYRAGFTWGLENGYDRFVEIDCDFSHDPAALPLLLEKSLDFEVVIGSRYVKGGSIPSWSIGRKLLSRGGNVYASMLLNLGIKDSTAGYRVYQQSALEKIKYQNVGADGYGFQIEMTYRARNAGASIIEVPISFVDREQGQSKMSQAIVIEALWLVTKWGLSRPFGGPRFLK
jgi:dolichol-phosphate mannosyltransferase